MSAPDHSGEVNKLNQIPGLSHVQGYISHPEHDALLERITEGLWLTAMKRRVQHYGYQYDYKAHQINLAMRVGALPGWLQQLAERLQIDRHISTIPDQVIINEYLPGQGITDHVDCEPCFDDTVISLSLGSGCLMNLTRKVDKYRIPIWLEPRSILILKGEARYEWTHGIPARKADEVNGQRIERATRVSLTFRKVILG